ncbi:hypothetical protein GTA08_BOTSDO12648 [Botryosphaeria dothidea]|uniref:Amidohydrolase-related domain-containing protein n=1 Tax=Botryosphaeria dothidea TaxID=55169 RepID=A0A8H4J289_9PEZI|nr:hypothetical protein GTA08_BOTSDO14014 [Botryosphaeria dothidea]KAF4311871.1 hypothetical protein GTA08_BOTSDO12648 [Botryosphaeria dothidea]
MLPCITLEEHYLSPILFSTGLYSKEKLAALSPAISEKLSAVDDARVKNMDATGVSVQHPKRFRSFALLSMVSPAAAAAELRRCVQDLGFVGALVGNHLDDGTFYDAPAYDAVWAVAQALDVPVHLHPQRPSDAHHAALYAGLGDRRLEMDLACWC